MNWKGFERKWWPWWCNVRFCLGVCLESSGKTTQSLSQDFPPPRRFEPRSPECEERMLGLGSYEGFGLVVNQQFY